MKNKILALVFLGFLILLSFSVASAANYSNSGDDSCCCCCLSNCKMMCVMKCDDIDVNVETIKDGVVVKITSENAEVVKKVQEMCVKMKEMCAQKECCKKESNKEKAKK